MSFILLKYGLTVSLDRQAGKMWENNRWIHKKNVWKTNSKGKRRKIGQKPEEGRGSQIVVSTGFIVM